MSSVTRTRRIAPPVRLAVDVRGSLGLVGTLVKYLSPAALFPAAVALGYGEPPWPFLVAFAVAAAGGLALERVGGPSRFAIGTREGYVVIAVAWLFAAAFGAIPFLLSGEEQLSRPVDALFEAMSGFTTTGSTILVDIDALDHSLAMWRQFMQWLGGLGIIVLALAVLPRLRVGGRQLLESELPGPEVDQLGERIRRTVQRLWILYVALTATQAGLLTLFGWTGIDDRMSPYDAVATAFTTIPTGGFSTESRSIEAYGEATQWLVIVFMVIAGLNFALLWRALVRRQPHVALRDQELRLYGALLALGSAVLILEIWTEDLTGGESPIRHGIFQAVALMTGTGYATVDFALWTPLALMTLVMLMFFGGSAGSTTGSVKILRHLLLARALQREVRQTFHPELISPIRLNGRPVEERIVRGVVLFLLLYLGLFAVGAGLLATDAAFRGPDLTAIDAISAAAATLGNVGPAAGPAGPMSSYAPFSDEATLLMTALMWLGRLEVLPVVVLFTRSYWRP